MDINPDVKPLDVARFKLTPSYLLHESNKVSRQPAKLSLLELFKLERMYECEGR